MADSETIDTKISDKKEEFEEEIDDKKSTFETKKKKLKINTKKPKKKAKILQIMFSTIYHAPLKNLKKVLKTCKKMLIKNIKITKNPPYKV